MSPAIIINMITHKLLNFNFLIYKMGIVNTLNLQYSDD